MPRRASPNPSPSPNLNPNVIPNPSRWLALPLTQAVAVAVALAQALALALSQARKSPVVDGKVMRNARGKEVRFPVILTAEEKEIARKIVLAFGQVR